MCTMTHSCVWNNSFMCTMTHSYVWHGSFICTMTHSYVWHNLFMCTMTHSYAEHDSFICVTWLIHMREHDSYIGLTISIIRVAWRIHMCATTNLLMSRKNTRSFTFICVTCVMTRSYVWQVSWLIHMWYDSFICVTCVMTHSYVT